MFTLTNNGNTPYLQNSDMSNRANITPSATPDNNTALKEFIKEYKAFLNDLFTDVCDGEQMLDLGAKTKVIQDIESIANNHPLITLANIKSEIDHTLAKVLVEFISHFINQSKEIGLISTAFKKVRAASLYFGIVLKEDNFENREKVLEFLTFYYSLHISEKIPVYFQFMSEEDAKTFKKVEFLS